MFKYLAKTIDMRRASQPVSMYFGDKKIELSQNLKPVTSRNYTNDSTRTYDRNTSRTLNVFNNASNNYKKPNTMKGPQLFDSKSLRKSIIEAKLNEQETISM